MSEKILRLYRRILWQIFRLLPIKENKVVFMSYYGRGYSDNPKYIAEEMMKQNLDMQYVWVVTDEKKNDLPSNFVMTKLHSCSYIYHMSTAKIWIDNARKYYCVKKKGQIYIQTWHGGFGLKKIEKDVEDRLDKDYIKMAKRDAKQTDIMLSNSRTLTNLYRTSFWYENGEILEKGLPRNDRLFCYEEEEVGVIRKKIGIPSEVKICLYAPTFRKGKNLDVYNLDYERCIKNLEKYFGGKWIVLLRLHPNIFNLSNNMMYNREKIYNVSYYNDIQDLYIISDLAITDYSSIMFDFMLLRRPCFLYASDVNEYRKERDFFVSLDSLPFPLAQNNNELEKIIESFNENRYYKEINRFKEYHGFCDQGNASVAIVEWIKKVMKS